MIEKKNLKQKKKRKKGGIGKKKENLLMLVINLVSDHKISNCAHVKLHRCLLTRVSKSPGTSKAAGRLGNSASGFSGCE
jgi:hypothetical protein